MPRFRSLALLLALALTASGCAAAGASAEPGAAPGTGSAAGSSVDPACPASAVPLADLALESDPRAATGPSTACLPSRAVAPVDGGDPALPVTVTDVEDRRVTITDVDRILAVDISGTIAATVFGLGLGNRVVGRDASTDFPGTEDLPVVTDSGHTLNAEAILELAPTVMLTDTSIGPKEVRQQLRDAGIPVVVITGEHRLDTADDLIREVAAALGVPGRGDSLAARLAADLDATVAEIFAIAPDAASDRPRMLFLYVRGNANVYYIFGRDSGADSLIEAVGGIDVAGEIGWEGMKPMNAEALVAAQPDVLVMMTDGLASVGGVDGLLERIPALAQTPAGEHRRVIDMADADILSFGPRSAEIVRALARALYAPAE